MKIEKLEQLRKKRRVREEKWEARMKPIREGWQKFLATFTFDPSNWKILIKRTKQFVGAIITIILLGATFFIVQWKRIGQMFKKFNGWISKLTFGLIVAIFITIFHYIFALMHTLYEIFLYIFARQAFRANLQKLALKV